VFRFGLFFVIKKKHFINKALKVSAAFLSGGKVLVKIVRGLVLFVFYAFTDDGIFMLLDAQVKMTARVAYIIQIKSITLKFIHNAFVYR